MRRTQIRKVSKKRAVLLRVYKKRRDEFLAAHPVCQRCPQPATEVHHAAGRIGAALIDPANFRALCHDCHEFLTAHPVIAYETGFSLPRVGRAS